MRGKRKKTESTIYLQQNPVDIKNKYDRMLRNGYDLTETVQILSDLNDVSEDAIMKLVAIETDKLMQMGSRDYILSRRNFHETTNGTFSYSFK